MPLLSIPSGNVASATASTAYSVANSCRFTSGASMEKAFGTPTNLDKWTFSCWLKRGNIGAYHEIFSGFTSGTHYTHIEITDGDKLEFGNRAGGGAGGHLGRLITNRLFRDVAAWYNIVCVWDSDNATAGNRMRVYINGVEETSFSTEVDATSGELCHLASGDDCVIGLHGTSYLLDGYLAEVVLIDGQALTPTSFGEFDSDSPTIWKPIDVSGLTFGNNGFYLDFEDSSNLGNDANGGTDLTETSLAATDQSTDTCTNNFCTFNPLDVTADDEATLSEGNLKAVADGAFHQTRSTFYLTTGKWYWEFKATSVGDALQGGVVGSNYAGGSGLRRNYQHSAAKYTDGSSSSYGATFTDGDIIGVALDLDNGTLIFYKNGSTQGTAFTDMLSAIGEDGWTPDVIMYNSTAEMNFGSPSYSESGGNSDANGHGNFAGSVPSGYFALCTKNLAESG